MKIYLVGGAVRDELLGLPVKEKDWVVVGATVEEMIKLGYKPVGKDFPVFLHPETKEEYALARTERKVGLGYQGFTFNTSLAVTLEDDLRRRDLTINAIAKDGDTFIDPYEGLQDLENKVLKHVSPAFEEDPVRILRLGRFAARFTYLGFKVHPDTMSLMREMVANGEVNALVAERVWKEMERALTEKNPEAFFTLLNDCGAMGALFSYLRPHSLDVENLTKVALNFADPQIRFAVLCQALTEEELHWVCEIYRVPVGYRDLAFLLVRFGKQVKNIENHTPEKILDLLKSLDAFRREDRFNKFLSAIGESQWLKQSFEAAKNVTSKNVNMDGKSGREIADALDHLRVEAIRKWLIAR